MGGQAQHGIVRLVYRFAEWSVIVTAGGAVHFNLDDCWPFCYVLVMVTLGQVVLNILAKSVRVFEVGEDADINSALFDVGCEYIGGQKPELR